MNAVSRVKTAAVLAIFGEQISNLGQKPHVFVLSLSCLSVAGVNYIIPKDNGDIAARHTRPHDLDMHIQGNVTARVVSEHKLITVLPVYAHASLAHMIRPP